MAHRCAICDRTDNRANVLTTDQLYFGNYLKDTRDGTKEICQECVDAINETIYEDDLDDEPISVFPNY